jgi:protocatechuate 3,4-dioxygenase alpha subunit
MTTPGQTVGPFFHDGLPYAGGGDLVPPGSPGAIRLHGHVYDGAGQPVPDALLEIWQTDPDGNVVQTGGSLRRDGWTFTGWGRAATDLTGHYSFSTLRPGAGSPFFAVTVFARGLTDRLFTRAYLPGADNPFLASLDPDRRDTLIAVPDAHGFVFDVWLQGDRETVFLSFPQHRDAD